MNYFSVSIMNIIHPLRLISRLQVRVCCTKFCNITKNQHQVIRSMHSTIVMSASKDKPKKKSSTVAKIDLSIGENFLDLKELNSEMQAKVDKLRLEYRQKYPLKITAECIDNIYVTIDTSDSTLPLREMAHVSMTEKEFIIRPMLEKKNMLNSIVKGIANAELNINPTIDGDIIKFIAPASTTEYRNNILKLSKASGEKVKVILRKIRQKASINLRNKNASIDTIRRIEEMIQLVLDSHINQIDDLYAKKTEEMKK
ncbi:ribosome-recycling factor isoform X2 [Hydra vulgaris]|uniref:Ribosome-recycling factor, mitochondrial n=1 Tax=Hydra vulgaris TaxID=6087 RepID=A0ABM4DK29_HYDVU